MSNFHPEIIKTMAGVSGTPDQTQTNNTNTQSQHCLGFKGKQLPDSRHADFSL